MAYADGMAVDRLSVTVPSDLGIALRALAKARGANVSSVVTEAIAREVRAAALDVALAEADARFGVLDEELISRANAELVQAAKRGKRVKRRAPR
jgi:post-segregation antitoxin (ccd killing protein)